MKDVNLIKKNIRIVTETLLSGGVITDVDAYSISEYYYDIDKGLMMVNKNGRDIEAEPLQHFIMDIINGRSNYKAVNGKPPSKEIKRAVAFFMEYLEFEFKTIEGF